MRSRFFCLCTLVGACLLLLAAPTMAGTELRTGLVLSGGGARGAAHVGVLRELEAAHVRIDAIAGTSMGAVVGGLYASGMSTDDIERMVGGAGPVQSGTGPAQPPRTAVAHPRLPAKIPGRAGVWHPQWGG